MTAVLALAGREIRAGLRSPWVLSLIAGAAMAASCLFFHAEPFFERDLADVRPLYSWLALILTIIVPALGMDVWSAKRSSPSIELLLTLPVTTLELVLGRYLGRLVVVTWILVLTTGLPFVVTDLGDLDWGPVWSGYTGTALVAATYLAITMWVSSMTHRRWLAFVLSAALCGALHALGSDPVGHLLDGRPMAALGQLGTSRPIAGFARGVIDLSAVTYLVSLVSLFLILTMFRLGALRRSRGTRRRREHLVAWAWLVLFGVNLVLHNACAATWPGGRADWTDGHALRVAKGSRHTLARVRRPLRLRAVLSGQGDPTHTPVVSRIVDTLEEYAAAGGPLVVAEVVEGPRAPGQDSIQVQYGSASRSIPISDLTRIEDGSIQLVDLDHELTGLIAELVTGPGATCTVGVATGPVAAHGGPVVAPSRAIGPQVAMLQSALGGRYLVEQIDLEGGPVPRDVDVVMVSSPAALSAGGEARLAAYLAGGGGMCTAPGALTNAAVAKGCLEPSVLRELHGVEIPTGKLRPTSHGVQLAWEGANVGFILTLVAVAWLAARSARRKAAPRYLGIVSPSLELP